ncbi:DUF2625 family protein, partial [Pseudomonas syringae]
FLGHGDSSMDIVSPIEVSGVIRPAQIGYTDFLSWALSDRIAIFYDGLRWEGWRSDLKALGSDQCFSFFPFLWTQEGSIEKSSRAMIDVIEQFEMNVDLSRL